MHCNSSLSVYSALALQLTFLIFTCLCHVELLEDTMAANQMLIEQEQGLIETRVRNEEFLLSRQR